MPNVNRIVRRLSSVVSGDEVPQDGKVALPRHLGVWDIVWHTVGSVIGTGIFISPSGVLEGAGGSVGLALVFWVLCGVFQTCGGFIYVELVLLIKKSGGELAFLNDAWGPAVAFLKIWVIIFIHTAGTAITANIIPQYLLTPFFQCTGPPTLAVRFMGMCVVFFMIGINSLSIKLPTKFAGFFTITKTVGLIVVIITGMYNLAKGHTVYLQNAFSTGSPHIKLLPIAFYTGMYAYAGWDTAATFSEEVKRPERNIPLGMVISMTIVTSIYFLTNVAYFTLLSPEQVLSSKAVAAEYSVLALGRWSWLVWFFVAMSAMGALNSSIFKRGRQLFALAREGLLPEIFSMLNITYFTPIPAVSLTLIGLIYLIEGDVIAIIRYGGFVEILLDIITVAALPYFRWKWPDRERPFKVPLVFVFIYMAGLIFMTITAFVLDPVRKCIGLVVALSGLPVYFAFYSPRYRIKRPCVNACSGKITRFLQKLFNCVHQEKATF